MRQHERRAGEVLIRAKQCRKGSSTLNGGRAERVKRTDGADSQVELLRASVHLKTAQLFR